MPLEATMLLIDNSEYMRNGDYQPSRYSAQSDAVNTVYQTKTDSNPENTVGVMSMAGGKGPEVLVTHTKDLGQVLQALHSTSAKIAGEIDMVTAIAIAQLALKHRENKNLRQRIIVFVGSPVDSSSTPEESQKTLIKLAKKLKKNNVAVDVVCFGDGIEQGEGVLKSFVEAASSGDNSHIITVLPGTHLISDALIASPILAGDRGAMVDEAMGVGEDVGGAGPATGNAFEFGVDPSLDPELAMALRMSMQEAQAREAAASSSTAATAVEPSSSAPAPASVPAPSTSIPASETDDEEEALLARALSMSNEGGDVEMGEDDEDDEDEDEDEDAAIQRAIEMSMRGEEEEKKGKK